MDEEMENSDDELPSITLSQDSSTRSVVMPSASEVAVERAREQRTERELARLREMSPTATKGMTGDGERAGGPPRSDSSGSEGETALAAAVRALRVLPEPRTRVGHSAGTGAARRLLALLPTPQDALGEYAGAFAGDPSCLILNRAINQMAVGVSCAVSCELNAFTEDEVLVMAGAMCAACLAGPAPPSPRPAPRRALHAALARAPTDAVAVRLADIVARAVGTKDSAPEAAVGSARALLAVSDAARGGPRSAELLAALLVRRALELLLAPADTHMQQAASPLTTSSLHALLTSPGGGWRALLPPARLAALRGAGRVLRGGVGGEGAGAVLAVLTQPSTQQDKHHPDYLKVAVAASTLQLLFRSTQA